MNMEGKVADAILQCAKEIEIGSHTFQITPPTPATLIMCSKYIADIPDMKTGQEVLLKAKDARALGLLFATLVLGAKRVKENRKIKLRWWKKQSEVEYIADYILDNLTNEEVSKIVTLRLGQMQISDFFAITTFLKGADITKPTKEVVTASGEQ